MSSASFDQIASYIWPGAGYLHRDSDEYPFKRDLEDLLCSPKVRSSEVECLEEGEIEGSHSLPDSSTTQIGVSQQETPSRDVGVSHFLLGSSTT